MRTKDPRTHGLPLARAQLGVSLVEVMVALTMGLFVVGGAAAIYLANRNSFATVENVARVEENARFAAELLARDIREAGNSPCGGAMSAANLISSSASPTWAGWDRGLLGNPMAATGRLAVTVARPPVDSTTAQVTSPATNSLLVWSASKGAVPVRITNHVYTPGTGGTFTTATAHGVDAGKVLVACDGRLLLTFEVASVPSSTTLTYTSGDDLDLYFTRAPSTFKTGGFISPLSTQLWYVGGNSERTDANALRRITLAKDGTFVDNAEIITGVRDFQVRYLVGDTTGTPDPSASYRLASAVTDWTTVIAAQLTLTLTSLDKINPAGGTPSVFTYQLPMTVGIRQRLQP